MKPIVSFLVLVAALLLSALFYPVGVFYTLLKCLIRLDPAKAVGYLSAIFWSAAILLDLGGNTICRDFLNDAFIKAEGYRFGNDHETISRVLALNQRSGTLTDAGRGLCTLLNYIDKGHLDRTINP